MADKMIENYDTGRTAGVTGTYGTKRKGLAEKTDVANGGPDLASTASKLYRAAVENRGTGGDKALTER